MKYLLTLSLLFSVAFAQTLPEQYASMSVEQRQNYDLVASQIKPKLKPLEDKVLSIATNINDTKSQRVQTLSDTERQLEAWVGNSLLKYTVMLPLRSTIKTQIKALADSMVLTIPYQPHQIKSQFNVSGAQLYAYGAGNLTLVRGTVAKGTFARGEKIIIYFKQGGPVITTIEEVVSNPGDKEEAYLLSDKVSPVRFVGGAALFIPQS